MPRALNKVLTVGFLAVFVGSGLTLPFLLTQRDTKVGLPAKHLHGLFLVGKTSYCYPAGHLETVAAVRDFSFERLQLSQCAIAF